MSRIFEALQRADLERKNSPGAENLEFTEPVIGAAIQDETPAKDDLFLEQIAEHPWNPSIESFPTLEDRGAGVEQFRSLRSRIYQARFESPMKSILITSGMPSEGKSFVAANLAMSLARNTIKNILLIDGDLRRPTLHNLLGAPNTPGLSEYLSSKAELREILQCDQRAKSGKKGGIESASNLTFIPAGQCTDTSSELMTNHRLDDLMASLAPHFDWIIIDSPPVMVVTDAVDLARTSDAVLLVARGASTKFDVAQRTQAAFNNSRILGFVLNAVKDPPKAGSYSYSYYYGGPEIKN
jgi:capsular exopolysaccharide synthesis family protein